MVIHIYRTDVDDFDAAAVSNYFVARVNAERNGPNGYVVDYPGQSDVIAFNLNSSMYYSMNKLHPGGRSDDGADPTRLAVFLASFGGEFYNISLGDPFWVWKGVIIK